MNASRLHLSVLVVALAAVACRGSDEEGDGDDGLTGIDTLGFDEDAVEEQCLETSVVTPTLRRMTGNEYEATIRSVFPAIASDWAGTEMGGAPLASVTQFTNDGSSLVVATQVGRQIFESARDAADLLTAPGTLESVLPCAGAGDSACAQTFVETYGPQLHRRDLTESEVGDYVALYDQVASSSDFPTGLRWMIIAMLQSPHTVYRSELGDYGTAQGDEVVLEPHEVASALAYAFSGQPPSDELLGLAESGALYEPEARVEQARLMLNSPEGRQLVQQFFVEWTGYGRVLGADRLQDGSSELDESFAAVRDDMAEETAQFLDRVVFEDGGSLRDLMLSETTMLNGALASYYGYGSAGGDAFEPVSKPEQWGRGLLAQGAFLAARARPDTSSPTQRGLAVLDHITCTPRPSAPDQVPPLGEVEDPGDASTTRARWETLHLGNEQCSGCHLAFDPTGFAFENFDAKGRYRSEENGFEVDAKGSIRLDGETVMIDGVNELSGELAESPQVAECVSGMLAAYAYGNREGNACVPAGLADGMMDDDLALIDVMATLAGSPLFVTRLRTSG
ncbi:MAG: DUF1592 domain-containing protein [Myxococcota bacterium]